MIYILYHDNCFDGFTAAWSAWLKYGNGAKYVPCNFGNKLDIEFNKEDDVYVVDFSFPRDFLLELKDKVRNLVVIDHHKTAEEELKGLDFCIFDMNKSGALLTFEYFFPKDTVPKFVQYVSDRDLWNFKLPHAKEIHAYIASYPMTFENWNGLRLYIDVHFVKCVDIGESLLRHHHVVVDSLCKYGVRFDKFKISENESIELPVINVPKQYGSDVCVKLYETYNTPAAVYFVFEADKVSYGIRSRKDFDCSVIAKCYGGGGHKNASGWTLAL